MEELNLPHHVIETFEKRWARKLQQKMAAWHAPRSPTVPVHRDAMVTIFASAEEIKPEAISACHRGPTLSMHPGLRSVRIQRGRGRSARIAFGNTPRDWTLEQLGQPG